MRDAKLEPRSCLGDADFGDFSCTAGLRFLGHVARLGDGPVFEISLPKAASQQSAQIDMKKGGPSREGGTARRVTWACQAGSGSLLGNFVHGLVISRVRSFILDRFLR